MLDARGRKRFGCRDDKSIWSWRSSKAAIRQGEGLALGDIATIDLGRSGLRQVGRLRDASESTGRIG
ncbi:MAG: hypothetical protein CMD77_07670 [Gammaproteobacteria bacterium]|nr:hypothetical protein [Gammaproteobacteria bacterium]